MNVPGVLDDPPSRARPGPCQILGAQAAVVRRAYNGPGSVAVPEPKSVAARWLSQ